MLIDWFTVGAQVLNFLILVWLMKRFLYKPILNAIDAREKRIARQLADADATKAEAKHERDEFQHKNEAFEQQRAALLGKATDEANAERERLLGEARKAADALRAKRQESLANDARHLNQAITRRTQDEVFAIARKTLSDLATTSLEERVSEVFTRRVRELDSDTKHSLAEALTTAFEPGLVRSAFDLPAGQRAAIQNALNETFSADIPVGRGQRELILGDRQTGKTAIALDTILNQRGKNVLCVYCAIGQRAAAVAKAVAILREQGALDYTVVVVTEGNDAPGLAYFAPYTATSIAEHFMEAGRDVLIVYDDLTQHARAYRELSLLLRRPPGREAFPGDIFYIHSRLLERATHLSQERGGGSLTALPIIETEAQNMSAYIPTNLISITDGQIYLSPSLFALGVLPAVDVGKSVSRVGGKAQRAAYRLVAGDLKLAYAQFEELETFARFGARLDEDTRKIIEHGRRIRACLKQPELAPVSVPAQIALRLALTADLFAAVPLDQMTQAEKAVVAAAAKIPAEVSARFETAKELSDEDRNTIIEIARQALGPLQPKLASREAS